MKIQCSCGAKYEIDVTPGMQPIQFVCGSCGQDYSAFINDQIRRELGEPAAPTPPPPPVPTSSRLKISSAPTPAAASPESSSQLICARHREPAAEQCYVCKKPICPKCMELFGYFCSPFCKSKGSAMDVPVYEGQAFIKEARYSRKVGTITGVVVGILVLFVIAWIWYAWFASVPHAVLSVRFDEKSYSGTSLASDDQVVFLHGGTLARYDLKEKKPVWTLPLVTEQQIDEEMKRDDRQEMEARKNQIPGEYSSVVGPDVHRKWVRMRLESAYSLYGSGKNIWVANSGANTLTHYDWATGNVVKQIALNYPDEIKQRGNELVLLERLNDGEKIVHIDLAGGDMRTEDVHGFNGSFLAGNTTRAGNAAAGGLPLSPYGGGRPMDPQKVAAQAQNLSPAGRAALPAVIANATHQQKIFQEIQDDDAGNPVKKSAGITAPGESYTLVRDGDSYVGYSTKVLERRIVQRDAMKAPSGKSALDDPNLNGSKTADVANEMLNGMQRDAGGDKVTEDQSRYQVSIRRAGSAAADWSGEVVGRPQLFPQKTVNILAAGKTIIVLDKAGKKLWQTDLTHPVQSAGDDEASFSYGQGPCVERGDTLYVCDQAVLTAFDLATGNARWRLPSVGIVGLFFDDHNMVYVNTTTGNPDDLKYSHQIDVTKKTEAVVLKVDPQAGKVLWSVNPHGMIVYLSGKYMYAFYAFDPGDEEDRSGENLTAMMNPAFVRIARVDVKNGRLLWEHTEGRAPIDVKFDGSSIRLLFKKEVEVLRFWSL